MPLVSKDIESLTLKTIRSLREAQIREMRRIAKLFREKKKEENVRDE